MCPEQPWFLLVFPASLITNGALFTPKSARFGSINKHCVYLS